MNYKHYILLFVVVGVLCTCAPRNYKAIEIYPGEKGTHEHPRLFFNSAQIPTMREKAAGSHSDIWQMILSRADAIVAAGVPEFPAAVETTFQGIGDDVYTTAFAYVITNDKAYARFTRDMLMEMSGWSSWGARSGSYTIRDFALQYMIRGTAYAYDWIYHTLSLEERVRIRAAIAKYAGQMYDAAVQPYNSEWQNWWGASYGQNHWSSNNSALGIAALALEGEVSEASTWLTHAISQLQIRSDILENIGDGTWHEGMQYQNADLIFILPFYHTLRQIKGTDLLPDQYLTNYVTWKVYNHLPDSYQNVFTFGDYVPDWRGGYGWFGRIILTYIADHTGNGYAQWLADNAVEQIFTWDRYPDDAPYLIYEFLYYDPAVSATAPAGLPLSRVFPDLDCVIWRTGWENDDVVFGLKAGAYCGKYLRDNHFDNVYPSHDHPDIPSFYLYKGGSDLSSEMADNHPPGTIYHNTILVDDQGQYFSEYGDMYHDIDGELVLTLETVSFNFLIADATDRYKEDSSSDAPPGAALLNEFRRFVLFVKPDYFVILDNLRSDVTRRYDWLCHFAEGQSEAVSVSGRWVKGPASNDNVLGVKVLSPADFTYEQSYTTRLYTNPPQTKPYIKIRPTVDDTDTRFITILYPTTTSGWNGLPDIQMLDQTGDGAGVRITDNGTGDHLFNCSLAAITTSIDEYRLAGSVASVYKDGSGVPAKVMLGNGTLLSDGNGSRVLIESVSNVTLELAYSVTSLAITGEDLSGVTLYAPAGITDITLNGTTASFLRTGDYITLE